MSIIKDYYFLSFMFSLITFLCIKCYKLKNEIISQKEYFIKTLGHDFRVSVIAQIRGLDLIKKAHFIDKENYKLVNEINDSCKYTLDMITMLMKIYNMENKNCALNYENININEILNKILNDCNHAALDKNIDLKYKLDNLNIIADREYLTKILKVLIISAIQHSKHNSVIYIINILKNDKNILRINYEGMPLSFEEQNRMTANSPNFSTVGHGIQMYLCKKLVDLHRGKLKYKSDSNLYHSFEINFPAI